MAPAPAAVEPPTPSPADRRRPRWPGRVALAFAILTAVGVATGIALATVDLFAAAWIVGITAVVLSALGVLTGFVAVIGRWGRATGIAAVAVAVLANPLVLTSGLELVATP